jgi:hypothetical protein
MARVTPLGALVRGLAAGAAGALVQSLYFRWSDRWMPHTEKVFEPPEAQQRDERSTETVARRFVEQFARRGPLSPKAKQSGATAVHVGFGAAFGGMYGLAVESAPSWRGPLGSLVFGGLVWALGDEVLLPAMKLSAWPHKYSLATHGYALSAHLAYGLGTWASYELMQRQLWSAIGAGLWAVGLRRSVRRTLPERWHPAARRLVTGAAIVKALRPGARLRAMVEAARA